MAQEAIAFGAPRAEEMTKTVVGIAGGGIAGVVAGTVVMFSKKMGALEPFLSWGALLGIPALGVAGALFARGMIGDISQGVAAGGTAVLGYSLPAMLAPELFARGAPAGGGLLGAGNAAKLLGAGPAAAAEAAARAAAKVGVKSSVEF
ncbi:hypothetical protein ES703_01204 [subsurface metagenome]